MQESVSPGNKIFPVRRIGMSAVVLAPRQLAIKEPGVHRRHFGGAIVRRNAQILRAQQTEYRLRGHCGHEASLMIEPLRVTLLRHAVTDEGWARRAERQQFVSVYRQVVRR